MTKESKLFTLVFATLTFTLGVIVYFLSLEPMVIAFNTNTSVYLQSHLKPLIPVLQTISMVEYFLIPTAYILPVYFLIKKKKRLAILTFATASSWIIGRLLKEFFLSPCPSSAVILQLYPVMGNLEAFFRTQCFPSGHVFDYVSILGMTYYLNTHTFQKNKLSLFTNSLILLIISTIGLSRVALGAHWLTDVVAGYLFGFSWLTFLIYIHKQLAK